jgi:ADP-ribose pyrophosphatase
MEKPIVPYQIRKVFDGRVFTVQVESITLPGGGRLEAEIVRHPGSVVLIPVNEEGEIILVRQYRPAIGRWVWELPAGTLKHGEDADAAAARECQEEIGLVPTQLEHLGSLFPTPGYCDEEMNFYRVTGLRTPDEDDAPVQPDEDEDLEPRPFRIDAMRSMIEEGEIIDMKTVAALFWIGPE